MKDYREGCSIGEGPVRNREQKSRSFSEGPERIGEQKKRSFSDFTKHLEVRARERGVPLNGQFELTPLCNFRCGMCYVRLSEGQMSQGLLSTEQWKDLITQAFHAGMLRAVLTGGECLAYPGFKEVYTHLQSLGCEVTVLTNGALLDDDWIRFFLENPPAGIHITLYGDSDDVYERVTGQRVFNTVVEHIRAVRDADLPLQISVTPSRFLRNDVFGTLRLARELCKNTAVNVRLFTPREETGRRDQDIDVDEDMYLQIMKYDNELRGIKIMPCTAQELPPEGGTNFQNTVYGLQCGAGRSGFCINWKGIMTPCDILDEINAPVLTVGFEEAWQQINRAVKRLPRAGACDGCAYEDVCISCIGVAEKYAEPGEWPHALCEMTKRFVRHGVYRVPECK